MVEIGFGLPCAGQATTKDGIKQVAMRGDELGFQSL
jgi:hypothetical protein